MLPRWMRAALWASVPLNFFGAIKIAPPFTSLRAPFGFPDSPPFHGWLLSFWVFLFGLAYAKLAVSLAPERLFLGVAAWGKASFFGLLVIFAALGEVSWRAPLGAVLDLVFALVFGFYLFSTAQKRNGS